MSDLHFPDLHIRGFRGIKDLAIPQLGRVTLIAGKNNTGKSSVLEAVRLHAQNGSLATISSILSFREEHTLGMRGEEHTSPPENAFHVSALFNGFPWLSEDFGPVVISTSGKALPTELTMLVKWYVERYDEQGDRTLAVANDSLLEDPNQFPALVVNTERGQRVHRLDRILRDNRTPSRTGPSRLDWGNVPCVFVSPYSGERTHTLFHLWDGIALTDLEKDIVEALHIIDPNISAVNMIGGEARSRERTAMVRAENIARPVPLRSYGDGMNRLFAVILSLVNARGGILLIDEFENGLHYGVQLDAWRMIFRLSQRLDVQVFATTHSWDTIESFQKAASETPAEGTYLRLTRWNDGIILLDFGEDELARATHHRMEIR